MSKFTYSEGGYLLDVSNHSPVNLVMGDEPVNTVFLKGVTYILHKLSLKY